MKKKIHVYDFHSNVHICLDRKRKKCVQFSYRPFGRYQFLSIMVDALDEMGLQVKLHTDDIDVPHLLNQRSRYRYVEQGGDGATRVRLASFDEEGLQRLHRLVGSDPRFYKGMLLLDVPKAMYPDPDSRRGVTLGKRLDQVAALVRSEGE